MAAFNEVLPLQRSESDDKGKNLRVYDLHNYIDNDEGITYADVASRIFAFYDSNGDQIGIVDATVVLLDDYSVSIATPKDQYIKSDLIITLFDSTVYTSTVEFGLIQQSQYKLNLLRERNRINQRQKITDVIFQADQIVQAAVAGHRYGNQAYLFDERMNSANKYLDTIYYC